MKSHFKNEVQKANLVFRAIFCSVSTSLRCNSHFLKFISFKTALQKSKFEKLRQKDFCSHSNRLTSGLATVTACNLQDPQSSWRIAQ